MSSLKIPIDAITSRFGDRFNSVRSQSIGTRFANLRPVSEFLDLKRLSKPANFGEVQGRVNYNLSYFSSNYAVVFVMLSIYSLLTNPVLLFVIILVTGGLYGIGKLEGRDLELGIARFNTSQLYTGLLIVAVPLGIWASPISTVLWLIGATGGGLGGRPRAPYGTPRWGRPPGAQLGRQTRRRAAPWLDDDARIEEIDSEDEYNLRNGRAGYARDLVGGSGLRRRIDYNEYGDEQESMDGADYDLYDDADSTVAYAVHLAMKDKEDWLVDKALERIRRAQVMGQKNVRLSKSEVEALERKRMQTGARTFDRTRAEARTPDGGGAGRAGMRRAPFSAVPTAPYGGALDDGDVFDARPRSSGSPTSQRPRSMRSPQPIASPMTPLDSPHRPDRQSAAIPHIRSQASSPLKSPAFARPLPDDPHWVPPYQIPYPREPPPYPLHSPLEPRPGGSSNRTGLSPYVSSYGDRPSSSARNSFTPWYSPAKPAAEVPQHEEDGEESDSDADELHIVDVVERKVPTSPSSRAATGKGSRQRRSRP
ncbi:putative COPII vesicles protein Yip3 [Aspergillus affinis]|uniref:putative COPII vesicles protein Yip3 n=1 Tax=Aspergillus affinis TaxID=1070780 RepID=UPI0022FDF6E5|nr:prenylated Rab acceptor 1 [Aspergillus affinis]KAI9039083.1 prenylated Rab acceptor 1 [Aspergillus affinis]